MEELYGNSGGSVVLFNARALCMLVYWRHFDPFLDRTCQACGLEEENVEHSVLRYAGLCPQRTFRALWTQTMLLALGFASEHGVKERGCCRFQRIVHNQRQIGTAVRV